MRFFRKPEPSRWPVTMAARQARRPVSRRRRARSALIAALAAKAGLTGHGVRGRRRRGARRRRRPRRIEADGALVDVTRAPWGVWPYDDGSFDVALIRDLLPALTPPADRAACVGGSPARPAPRRPRVVIEAGAARRLRRAAQPPHDDPAEQPLRAAGFAAVRALAKRDGVSMSRGSRRLTRVSTLTGCRSLASCAVHSRLAIRIGRRSWVGRLPTANARRSGAARRRSRSSLR